MFGLKVSIDDAGIRRMAFEAIRRIGDLSLPMKRTMMFMRREAGERLKRRMSEDSNGKLRSSLTYVVGKTWGWLGSNLKYAAVQQLGHPRITAKPPLKYLSIPLLPHLRRRGIWPRDFNRGELFATRIDETLFLARTRPGKSAKLELLYKLVKRVRILARPYILFDAAARQFLRDELAKWIRGARGRNG